MIASNLTVNGVGRFLNTIYGNIAGAAGRLDGFSSGGAASSCSWGNQTGTAIYVSGTPAGGGWAFRDNNPGSGQVSMVIDGTVYIKEGGVNVGDAVKSFSVSGKTVTYTTLWGNTGTFTTQDTTYTSQAAASGGTAVSLVTTGEKYTWNNKSNLTIGTTATTAAAGNHTHTLTIASDSGTNQLSLAANTKYKITAGGSTYIFTTPADTNTWRGIQDNLTSSSNTTESLSAKQGYLLANGSARDSTKLPLSGGNMTGTLTFNKVAGAISYTGTQATYQMIKFKDNTADTYGNGIVIGGGGLVVIGGGESADNVAATHSSGGDEELDLTSDGNVIVWTNVQNGATSTDVKKFTFGTNGVLSAPGGFSGLTKSQVTTALGYTPPTTDTNTWRPVGTGATDAAAGNHTHGLSLAKDTGTSSISLAANTKYKLTAGGSTYIFTTPPDSNTTYTAATAAPPATGVASVQGTSTNYARQDHTHQLVVPVNPSTTPTTEGAIWITTT